MKYNINILLIITLNLVTNLNNIKPDTLEIYNYDKLETQLNSLIQSNSCDKAIVISNKIINVRLNSIKSYQTLVKCYEYNLNFIDATKSLNYLKTINKDLDDKVLSDFIKYHQTRINILKITQYNNNNNRLNNIKSLRDLFKQVKSPQILANIYEDLVLIQNLPKYFKNNINLLNKSVAIHHKYKNYYRIANNSIIAAYNYMLNDNYPKAMSLLDKSYPIIKNYNNSYKILQITYLKSQLLYKQNKLKDASKLINKSLLIYNKLKLKDIKLKKDLLSVKLTVSIALKDQKQSLEILKLIKSIK